MNVSALARRFAERLGLPSFAGTPYPDGRANAAQQTTEVGGSGTFNFGGFIRGEDFNPEMDSLTAVKNLDIMRRSDAQTNAAIQVITQPIRSADKSVDPAEETALDKEVADFVQWNLTSGENLVWDDFLRQALLMLVFGYYLFEKVWAVQDKGKYAGKVYYRKLAPRPPKTIWQWFTDENGELISVKQLAVKAGTYQFLDIPVEKLIRFTFSQEGDNFAGTSILRSAYPHWLIKSNLYVVDAVRAVRFGAGIPKAKLLAGYAPNRQDKENLTQTLMGMSSHQFSYIIEPENVEITILTPSSSQGGAMILPTINHHNEQITANVLARFLDMGGKSMGGSHALGKSAMDFFTNAEVSLGNLIEDVINKQVIRPLVDMNYDIDDLAGYPRLRFSGIRTEDLQAVAAILTSLSAAGMKFDDIETQNTFRNKMDLPELDEEDLAGAGGTVPTSPPGAPGAASRSSTNGASVGKNVARSTQAEAGTAKSAQDKAGTAVLQKPALAPQPASAPASHVENQSAVSMRPAGKARSDVPVDHSAVARTAVRSPIAANVPNAPRDASGQDNVAHTTVPVGAHMARSSTDNAGDAKSADAEGVSRNALPRKEAVRPPDREMAETRTLAMRAADGIATLDDSRVQTYQSTYGQPLTFWRQPTALEAQVLDLREMPRRLDSARNALLATLRGVREEQILRVASVVAQGFSAPKPPLVGKMQSDVLKIVTGVFHYGHESVVKELKKQKRNSRSLSDTCVSFADSHDMPFAVGLNAPWTSDEEVVERIPSALVQSVELRSLTATQASLSSRRILPEGMQDDLPTIVTHDGSRYIFDGHHRLSAAFARGEKTAKVRVVALADILSFAFAAPRDRADTLAHLQASVQLRVQTASERLVSSGAAEALRLKRAGWEVDEVEQALKIHLGEMADADISRLANMAVNEAFSLGRTAAAELNKDSVKSCTYSALLDASTCDVCESLDGQEFDLDSDEYEENMPPNANCLGGDQCRCTYVYVLDPSAEDVQALSEVARTAIDAERLARHAATYMQAVERSSFSFGGPGSGIKGHTTARHVHDAVRPAPHPDVVREVHRLHASGMSHTAIAKKVLGGGVKNVLAVHARNIIEQYHPSGELKTGLATPSAKTESPKAATSGEVPATPPSMFVGKTYVPSARWQRHAQSAPPSSLPTTSGMTATGLPVATANVRRGLNTIRGNTSDTSRACVAELQRVLDAHPGAAPRVKELQFSGKTFLRGHTNGLYTRESGRIQVATGTSSSAGWMAPKSVVSSVSTSASSWVADASVLGTSRHELGHSVQDHLPREAKAEWLSSFGKSSGAGFTKSEGSVGLGSNGRAAAQHVSEYAGKNHRELFAESFSLYTHKDYASGKVRQLPSSVHAFMDKHVGRKKS